MSSPYPPQTPPRRLERSRSNKVLGGVCAGVARYLNMDVTLVRVLTVVLTFFTGVPVVAYIVALFVMPEEQQTPYAGPPTGHVPTGATGPADPVWGAGGAPWDQAQSGATPPPPPGPSPSPQPSPEPAPATASPASGSEAGSVARSGAGRGDADPGGAVRRGKQLGVGAGRPAGCRLGAER